MAKALEKLTTEKKVFLGSFLYGIIENGKIREPNLSVFKNILSRHEQRGYDVSGFRKLAGDYRNFENLIKIASAGIGLKTKNLSKQLVRIYKDIERQYKGYEETRGDI